MATSQLGLLGNLVPVQPSWAGGGNHDWQSSHHHRHLKNLKAGPNRSLVSAQPPGPCWWHLTLNILELVCHLFFWWELFMALSLLFVGTSSVSLQFLLPPTIFARVQLWPGGTYVGPSWHPLKATCDKIASSVKPALTDAGSVLQEVTQNCTVVSFFSGVQVGSVWVWEKKHKALPPGPVLPALWLDLDMCWAILPSWLSALQGKVTKTFHFHFSCTGSLLQPSIFFRMAQVVDYMSNTEWNKMSIIWCGLDILEFMNREVPHQFVLSVMLSITIVRKNPNFCFFSYRH